MRHSFRRASRWILSGKLAEAGREALRTCSPAAGQYGASVQSVASRIARLYLRERFSPRESFVWGLADPRLPADELRCYVSKRRLLKLQAELNSRSRDCVTEDKSVFYPLCIGYGIAVPKLHAVIHPPFGWSEDGSLLRGRDQWSEYFEEHLKRDFVVKPAWGVYGYGLGVFERVGNLFSDRRGNTFSAADLYDRISSDSRYDSFVVQERVVPHPDLVKLSGTEALQTARMVTLTLEDRAPELVFATLKVIDGDNLSDNFSFGRSGNLLANISTETGRISEVVGPRGNGIGLIPVSKHPRTAVAFDGFRLPFWAEACTLVKTASLKFLPTRTIGWDVAITPSGPCIVEGNMWWDPIQNAHRLMGTFVKACGL